MSILLLNSSELPPDILPRLVTRGQFLQQEDGTLWTGIGIDISPERAKQKRCRILNLRMISNPVSPLQFLDLLNPFL